jgi:hypothetical protein
MIALLVWAIAPCSALDHDNLATASLNSEIP